MRERTHESEEMYLKTIERLTRRKGTVQPVEISEEVGYVKSCVSRAVKLLRSKGMIIVNETNGISLTASGRRRAEQVCHKYEVLKSFFETIGADEDAAENAACKIEHCISEEMCGLIALYMSQPQEHREKTQPSTNESVEMYLETILRLEESGLTTSLTKVAKSMNVSKPAVCKARQKLSELGYVYYDSHHMHLTETGRRIAESVYNKHRILTKLFMGVGVPAAIAEEDACRIEHIISDETLSILERHGESKGKQNDAEE